VPTAAPLSGSNTGRGSGKGSVFHSEITQDRAGGDEGDWTTVNAREVGLWIMGSRAKDGGYVR